MTAFTHKINLPLVSSGLIYGLIGFSLVKLLKTLAKTQDGFESAR